MKQRIALYGGSFDPIHNGHLIIARDLAEKLDITRVLLLPSRTPPHKLEQNLTSPEHRVKMIQLAIAGEALFEIGDHDLTCSGPSYTVNTVARFRELYPQDTELLWIVGADSLLELHTWYQVDKLVNSCRIVTAARPGSEVNDLPNLRPLVPATAITQLLNDVVSTPHIDISSTDIRQRLSQGKSIRFLVPDKVADYIAGQDICKR